MPADDQVGALAVADLVADDPLDHRGVVVVAGLEPATVVEGDRLVGQRRQQVGERDLVLGLDSHHRQRGAVVVRLEAALGDLAERHREQRVEPATGLGDALVDRYVGQPLDVGPADRRPGSPSRCRAAG